MGDAVHDTTVVQTSRSAAADCAYMSDPSTASTVQRHAAIRIVRPALSISPAPLSKSSGCPMTDDRLLCVYMDSIQSIQRGASYTRTVLSGSPRTCMNLYFSICTTFSSCSSELHREPPDWTLYTRTPRPAVDPPEAHSYMRPGSTQESGGPGNRAPRSSFSSISYR